LTSDRIAALNQLSLIPHLNDIHGMMQLKNKESKKKPIKLSVPRTYKPDAMELEDWQRELRKQFGIQQRFVLKNIGDHPVFSDFSLTNLVQGKRINSL